MTTVLQRSIEAGDAPVVIVRGGTDCTIEGYDGNRVVAETESRWGGLKLRERGEAIEVNAGGACTVRVPRNSEVKVYAGQHVTIESVRGPALVNAGGDIHIANVALLDSCNAGGRMTLDAERLTGDDPKFQAGKDIRLRIRDLSDMRVRVNDLGGYWEGFIGDGSATLWLKSGGVATLVTDQPVRGEVLGNIEVPG